jgi:hypothetical protein
VGNRAYNGAAITALLGTGLKGCTFYANETTWSDGATIEVGTTDQTLERCIIAGTVNGYGLGAWNGATLHCFCFWGNERGATVGEWVEDRPELGNILADPRFCDPLTGNCRLLADSPCLPGEHGGYACGLIGAYGEGCTPEPIEETTWGRIKVRFWEEAKKARSAE